MPKATKSHTYYAFFSGKFLRDTKLQKPNLERIQRPYPELLGEERTLLVPGQPPAVGRDSVLALTRELLTADAADCIVVEGSYLIVWTKENGKWQLISSTKLKTCNKPLSPQKSSPSD